jgi:hypothetical protein
VVAIDLAQLEAQAFTSRPHPADDLRVRGAELRAARLRGGVAALGQHDGEEVDLLAKDPDGSLRERNRGGHRAGLTDAELICSPPSIRHEEGMLGRRDDRPARGESHPQAAGRQAHVDLCRDWHRGDVPSLVERQHAGDLLVLEDLGDRAWHAGHRIDDLGALVQALHQGRLGIPNLADDEHVGAGEVLAVQRPDIVAK